MSTVTDFPYLQKRWNDFEDELKLHVEADKLRKEREVERCGQMWVDFLNFKEIIEDCMDVVMDELEDAWLDGQEAYEIYPHSNDNNFLIPVVTGK